MKEIRVSINNSVFDMTQWICLAGGGTILKTDDLIVYGQSWVITTEYAETGPFSHRVIFHNDDEMAIMFKLRFG